MQALSSTEVKLEVPWKISYRNTECDTWITLLEQFLASNYKDYTVTVQQDYYKRNTGITIKFANIEDATFFKLTKYT